MPRSKAPVTQVVWTFSALADVEGIRRYIGNFKSPCRPGHGRADHRDRERPHHFPHRGRQVPGTRLRETAIVRPYIRYRVEPDRVVIPARTPRPTPLDKPLTRPATREGGELSPSFLPGQVLRMATTGGAATTRYGSHIGTLAVG